MGFCTLHYSLRKKKDIPEINISTDEEVRKIILEPYLGRNNYFTYINTKVYLSSLIPGIEICDKTNKFFIIFFLFPILSIRKM